MDVLRGITIVGMVLVNTWGVLGANALLLYVATELGDRLTQVTHAGDLTVHAWTYNRLFASWVTTRPASLAWSVAFLAIWGLSLPCSTAAAFSSASEPSRGR